MSWINNDRSGRYFADMCYHVFGDAPHPGPVPKAMVPVLVALGPRMEKGLAECRREDALHATFVAGGGSDEAWYAMIGRAERAASKATHGQYDRSHILDIVEAEIL